MDQRNATIDKLFRENAQSIFRYSMFKLQNKDEAEDTVAEVFYRIMKQDLNKITDDNAWLIGIARNVIYEKYRKRTQSGTKEQELDFEMPADFEERIDESLADAEVRRVVEEELKTLDETSQEIIVMKLWEDLSFKQIADTLGEKENTIKSKYYRALDSLKTKLESKKGFVYSHTWPLLLGALAGLGETNDYAYNFSLSDKLTMENEIVQPEVKPVETVHKGLFSSTASKVVISGLAGVALLTGAVVVGVNLVDDDPEVISPTPVVTEVVTPTVEGSIAPTAEPAVQEITGAKDAQPLLNVVYYDLYNNDHALFYKPANANGNGAAHEGYLLYRTAGGDSITSTAFDYRTLSNPRRVFRLDTTDPVQLWVTSFEINKYQTDLYLDYVKANGPSDPTGNNHILRVNLADKTYQEIFKKEYGTATANSGFGDYYGVTYIQELVGDDKYLALEIAPCHGCDEIDYNGSVVLNIQTEKYSFLGGVGALEFDLEAMTVTHKDYMQVQEPCTYNPDEYTWPVCLPAGYALVYRAVGQLRTTNLP